MTAPSMELAIGGEGCGGIERDCTFAKRAAKAGRAGAHAARLLGKPLLLCGGTDVQRFDGMI